MVSVHDCDTMRVQHGNQIEQMRFAFIDAPGLQQCGRLRHQ
ncbi:MAG: hypothetical protein AAF329_03525 [Cyanobacteria bacterium P01_A01_bin.17]